MLTDQVQVGGVFTDSNVRAVNDTGTLLVSAASANTGEELADEYTLVLSSVSAGSGTITVTAASPNNPFGGRVVSSVLLDGTTARKDIVPGVSLTFTSGSSNGHSSTVFVGVALGTFDSAGVEAGVPSAGVRHKVVNNGDTTVNGAKARLLTQAILVKKTGLVFSDIESFAVGATEKVAVGTARTSPYQISVSSTSGSGAGKVVNLLIDGAAFPSNSIRDLTTNALSNGSSLKAVSPDYPYLVISGPLTGLQFSLNPAATTGDSANVLIFPSRYVQIAPDVSGAEGTYNVTDVNLTESGQSAGVITAGHAAYYWVRVVVPQSAASESNPYPAMIALESVEAGSADWLI